MFKFDFHIEDAEDIHDLAPGSELDDSDLVQGCWSPFCPELEPFTEHSINQLVRL